MATYTTNTDNITPPANTAKAIIEAWGEVGSAGTGSESNGSGGNGGYIKAEVPVKDSDTLYVRFEGGAPSMDAGGAGGDGADVRKNGTSLADRVVAAGGGGGGGAARSNASGDAAATSGANAEADADDQTVERNFAGGGHAGSGSSGAGTQGGHDTTSGDKSTIAHADGGGGGGGWVGGGGGGAATDDGPTNNGAASAAGGGGGTSNTTGTELARDNTNNAGSPQVTITYETVSVTPPTNLTITSHDNDSIGLSWTGDAAADDYRVYRAESSGSTTDDYSQVGTPPSASFNDTGLEAGERYYYRVTAVEGSFETSVSNEVDQISDLPTPALDSLDAATEDEITVNWTKNDDSTDGYFEMYRSQNGTLGSLVHTTADHTATSWTDTGREDGEQYHYTVRRVTDHAASDSTQQSAVALLPAPTIDSLDNSVEDEITVNWTLNDDSPDGNVELYRSTDGTLGSLVHTVASVDIGTTTSWTNTGRADGEQYHYTVRRVTDHTNTDTQKRVVALLPAPTDLTSPDQDASSIDLNWTVNHDNGTQRVDYKRSSDSTWTTDASGIDRSVTSYTITGLLNGEEYDVRVVAVTEHNETVGA